MTQEEKIVPLYEDADLVAVKKPVGLLSAPSPEEKNSVSFLLQEERGGDFPITPVNRLDRNVGGLMLLVKNRVAAAYYSAAVSAHEQFVKEYLAVLEGTLAEKEGELHDLLFKDSHKNKTFVVDRMRKGVKAASLSFRILKEREGLSLVLVRLHTGRTHQIRVQFASRKAPLYGDGKYGARGKDTPALYSHRISFLDRSGKPRAFVAYPPNQYPWSLFSCLQAAPNGEKGDGNEKQ